MSSLADKISRAMKAANLNKAELMTATGISDSVMDRLLSDKFENPKASLRTWILLSTALNVPIEYFASDEIENEITQTVISVRSMHAKH